MASKKISKFIVKCKVCGKEFYTIPARVKIGRGKYCSKKCSYIFQTGRKRKPMSFETKVKLSLRRVGTNNPAYKDGSSYDYSRYRSLFPRRLRQSIKNRDNYTCQKCFSKNNILVHHIDENPLNFTPSNLVTWCRTCHSRFHRHHKFPIKLTKKEVSSLFPVVLH